MSFTMSTLLSSPLTVTLLSSVALAITVRLFYHGIGARGLPGCGPHSGCDEVTRSRWSRCGRVPVASLGSLMYLMACIASLLTTVSRSVVWERTAWLVLISLVPLLVSSALWFTALQLLVIRRMCRWCTIAHALSLLISVFVLYGAREYGRHSRVGGDFITQHWAVQIPGAMVLALLIGLQILIKPPTYAIFRVPEPPSPWWTHVLFWSGWLSFPEKAYTAFVGFLLAALAAGAALILRRPRAYWASAALALGAGVLSLDAGLAYADISWSRHAVVTGEIIARKGIGKDYEPAFDQPLKDGAEFTILSENGDWVFGHFEGIGDGWLRREHVVR